MNTQHYLETVLKSATLLAAHENGWTTLQLPQGELVTPASSPKFGDYQSNIALTLSQSLNIPATELAPLIAQQIKLDGIAVVYPMNGFINFALTETYVMQQLSTLTLLPTLHSQTIVVDYFGPNLAKELHVGHLKGLAVGDAIANILKAQGHTVFKKSHYGDFGLPIAMIVAYQTLTGEQDYVAAKLLYQTDEQFQLLTQSTLLNIQSGKCPEWVTLQEQAIAAMEALLHQFNIVDLMPDAESLWANYLPEIAEELADIDLLVEDEGAQVIFLEGFETPLMFQKSNGAYTYAATDLAALKARLHEELADTIIYVTGQEQSLHFAQLFAAAKLAGWVDDQKLIHIPLGLTTQDGKKISSSNGNTPSLSDLADANTYQCADWDFFSNLKFAQLIQSPHKNTEFAINTWTNPKGSTASFILEAIQQLTANPAAKTDLAHAKLLLQFNTVLNQSATELNPTPLAYYLMEVAKSANSITLTPLLAEKTEMVLQSGLGLLSK